MTRRMIAYLLKLALAERRRPGPPTGADDERLIAVLNEIPSHIPVDNR